ncbi:hypothetical protein LX36DRAFT_657024 [Colletotrichum falcatum]|nr:hypothetical protein LX36DRAFT_657024 [Colletotrichum falcatum]
MHTNLHDYNDKRLAHKRTPYQWAVKRDGFWMNHTPCLAFLDPGPGRQLRHA